MRNFKVIRPWPLQCLSFRIPHRNIRINMRFVTSDRRWVALNNNIPKRALHLSHYVAQRMSYESHKCYRFIIRVFVKRSHKGSRCVLKDTVSPWVRTKYAPISRQIIFILWTPHFHVGKPSCKISNICKHIFVWRHVWFKWKFKFLCCMLICGAPLLVEVLETLEKMIIAEENMSKYLSTVVNFQQHFFYI
jgi:hypothetical protein